MKTKEKIFHIVCIVFIISFVACFIFTKYTSAETVQRFYLTKYSNEPVDKGTLVEVFVHLDNDGVDGFKGTLIYDEQLILKETVVQDILSPWNFSIKPIILNENEVAYKDKKGICFAAFTNNSQTIENMKGDKNILKFVFDTSECENGTTYNLQWDTETTSLCGPKTYVKYDGEYKEVTTTNGTIKTTGTKPTVDDETDTENGNGSGSGTGDETDTGNGNETGSGTGDEIDTGNGNETASGAGDETDTGNGSQTGSGTGDETDTGNGSQTGSGTGDEIDTGNGSQTGSGAGDETDTGNGNQTGLGTGTGTNSGNSSQINSGTTNTATGNNTNSGTTSNNNSTKYEEDTGNVLGATTDTPSSNLPVTGNGEYKYLIAAIVTLLIMIIVRIKNVKELSF